MYDLIACDRKYLWLVFIVIWSMIFVHAKNEFAAKSKKGGEKIEKINGCAYPDMRAGGILILKLVC